MRRQINAAELEQFYKLVGKAIWYVQHLENILVSFLTLKVLHEQRCAGQQLTKDNAEQLLADKRKITLGPLIETCKSRKIIRPSDYGRFETFKLERHWLVHQCMIENRDDLYLDETRNAIFSRIEAIEAEAAALKDLIYRDMESWIVKQGVRLAAVTREAENEIRKLKGL